MDRSFSTPERTAHSAAAQSTSWHAQTNGQLGILHEGQHARSPTPHFPITTAPNNTNTSSSPFSPSNRAVLRSDTAGRTHISPPPRAVRQSLPKQRRHQRQQQQQRQQYGPPENFRSHRDRDNRQIGGAFSSRNNSNNGGHNYPECGITPVAVAGLVASWWQHSTAPVSATLPNEGSRARKSSPSGNSPDEDRRRCQRDKQIHFGYATDGYVNMERLIRHDPLLKSGGLLPLSPPTIVKGSKRIWDIQLRKWRRALHMFDYVFIDGEDDPARRAVVLEEQRAQWVSEVYQGAPRELRKHISLEALRAVEHASAVPTKIPVEEDLRCILRSNTCYESVRSVVPQSASSLTKGTDISPLEAGIKIHIAPSLAVLQRQQAQQELQQRLSSLQQQQQSQLQLHPEVSVDGAAVTATATGGDKTPLRPPSPVPTPAANFQTQPTASQLCRSDVLSPSPRRPQLFSPSDARLPKEMTGTGRLQQQHHQQQLSYSNHGNGSLSPPAVAPVEAKVISGAASVAVSAPMRHRCGTMGCVSFDTAGASASQPAPFSSIHTSLGSVLDESGAPGNVTVVAGSSLSPPLASVFLPPPPFPGVRAATSTPAAPLPPPLPSHKFASSPSTGVVPCAANAGFFTCPQLQPSAGGGVGVVYAPMPWYDARTTTFVSVPGGGHSGVGVTGAPWDTPQHMYVDPNAVNTQTGMSTTMLAVPATSTTLGVFEAPATGHLSGSLNALTLCPPPLPPGSSLERGLEVHTPSAELMRENQRRSGGGGGGLRTGAATPQTVPRFVARLSTSPSERRLGEQQQQQHRQEPVLHKVQYAVGDAKHDVVQMRNTGTSLSPLFQKGAQGRVVQSPMDSPTAAAKEPEKSQSLTHFTPERTLFGARASVEVNTEARSVQPRGDSVAESEASVREKQRADGSDESTTVALLSFHVETAQ